MALDEFNRRRVSIIVNLTKMCCKKKKLGFNVDKMYMYAMTRITKSNVILYLIFFSLYIYEKNAPCHPFVYRYSNNRTDYSFDCAQPTPESMERRW